MGSKEEGKKTPGRKWRNIAKMQQSVGERARTRAVCVEEEKKGHFEKFIEAGFYDEWGCVGLDGEGSKAAMCQGGRQRLFEACQRRSFLSHSYLVWLDRHSTKGEQRKRQALVYSEH